MKINEIVASPTQVLISTFHQWLNTTVGDDARVDLITNGSAVHLAHIETVNQGEGTGTEIMRNLCRMADQYGVPLTLHPEAQPGSNLSTSELITWYKTFGFHPDPNIPTGMIRPPRT